MREVPRRGCRRGTGRAPGLQPELPQVSSLPLLGCSPGSCATVERAFTCSSLYKINSKPVRLAVKTSLLLQASCPLLASRATPPPPAPRAEFPVVAGPCFLSCLHHQPASPGALSGKSPSDASTPLLNASFKSLFHSPDAARGRAALRGAASAPGTSHTTSMKSPAGGGVISTLQKRNLRFRTTEWHPAG